MSDPDKSPKSTLGSVSKAINPDSEAATAPSALPSRRLLEFLVCPVTKTTLQLSADKQELISRSARLAFPIRDGIPLLTRDTARPLTDEDDLKR